MKQSHSETGTLWAFFNIQCIAKHQKNEGDPLESSNNFREKVSVPKKLKGKPFSLVPCGFVCNVKK